MGYRPPQHTKSGCLAGMFMIVLGIGICMAVIVVATERGCRSDANDWLKIYPQAEVIDLEYSFLRPFSIGTTIRMLFSTDPAYIVRDWYIQTNTLTAEKTGKTYNGGFARMNFRIISVDGGTQITQYHSCATEIEIGN